MGVECLGCSVKEDGMCEDLSLLLRSMRVQTQCSLFAWAKDALNRGMQGTYKTISLCSVLSDSK